MCYPTYYMDKQYFTESGEPIRYPKAYAKTGAPMYETQNNRIKDINAPTSIYKLNLENGKKYIGKTTDVDRRMDEHFSGTGSEVTKKFKPKSGEIIDEVPGFFSDDTEQYHTEKYIKKNGYENVRGGRYVNSTTLHKTSYNNASLSFGTRSSKCKRCGRSGHSKSGCYASTHAKGYELYY